MTKKNLTGRVLNANSSIEKWLKVTKPLLTEGVKAEFRHNFDVALTLMHIEIGLKCIRFRDLPDTDDARREYGHDKRHRVHDLYVDATSDVRNTIERHYRQLRTLLPNVPDGWCWFETADALLAECNKHAVILRYDESDRIRKAVEQGEGILSHAGLVEVLRAVQHCLIRFTFPSDIIGRFLLPNGPRYNRSRLPPKDGEFGSLATKRTNDDGNETWIPPSTLRLLDANTKWKNCGWQSSDTVYKAHEKEYLMSKWLHECWNKEPYRDDPIAKRILELSNTHFVRVDQDRIVLTPVQPK